MQDRVDLALRYLEMATRNDPGARAPRLRILDLYLVNGEPESALAYLEECPDAMCETPEFLERFALALEMRGRHEEAGLILDQALTASNQRVGLMATAADNRLLQGKIQDALLLMESASLRAPEKVPLLTALGDLCHTAGRYMEEADYRMKLATLDGGDPSHIRRAAQAYIMAGQIGEGIVRMRDAMPNMSHSVSGAVKAAMGFLHYRKGDWNQAEKCFQSAMDCPDFTPSREEILALAEIHMRKKAYERAAVLLEDQLHRDPGHGLTRAALAWALYCAGSPERGLEVMGATMEKDSNDELIETLRMKLEGKGHED
jgi:tetratricopeptide (TPR) repeat protein